MVTEKQLNTKLKKLVKNEKKILKTIKTQNKRLNKLVKKVKTKKGKKRGPYWTQNRQAESAIRSYGEMSYYNTNGR